jgi:type IV secretory pathway TraG/TraD family ATPase VirD4
MKFVYFGVFVGLAAMCWGASESLSDRWPRLSWWLRSAMWGAGIMALAAITDREAPTAGAAAGAFVAATLIANLLRNAWAWVAGQISRLFGGGGNDGHLRGAKLVSGKTLQKILRSEEADLTLGLQKFPCRLEPLHLLITGATGTGKSVAISEMLDGIERRNDRVFIVDAGGNFLKNRFNERRGDIVLNPFDARCPAWSPLAEMQSDWDADRIAKSIVPDADGSAREWNAYAQTFTSAILRHVWRGDGNNGEIFRLGLVAGVDELRTIFAGTPASALVAEGNDRMFSSVRAIAGTYLSPLQYLDPSAGRGGFSLQKFASDDGGRGWVFCTFRDDQLATLRPLIACFTDIVSTSILSLDADANRKFWLILDEFASLGKVSSIFDFLTKARKNGGRAIVGLQSVSQLRDAYGRDGAQTLLSCLSSLLVLRCPDAETADIMSRALGDAQIVRVVQSGGESKQGVLAGGGTSKTESWSQQIAQERIVMPSELQSLPDLAGYLNLAGDIPTAPVRLIPESRAVVARTFEPAPARPQLVFEAKQAPVAPEPATLAPAPADELGL